MVKKKGLSVLLVAKQNKTGMRCVEKAEKMIKKYTDDIQFDRSTAFRLRKRGTSIRNFKGDFIITLGGDGTYLMTAHKASVPVLPIRIEGKGFLCTTDWEDLPKHIDDLFKKKFLIKERMRIRPSKISGDALSKYIEKIHRKDYPFALNEIAFARKRPSKLLNIEIKIGDTTFKIIGDGVIFSTPAGSTAYSASAGGSIIDPSLEVINIIPLYPFYSKVKPIVIPADKKVELAVRGGDCSLIVDGHGGDYFKTNTRFVVEKAKPARVIAFEEKDFFHRVARDLFET